MLVGFVTAGDRINNLRDVVISDDVVMIDDNSEKKLLKELPSSQAARTFGVAGCRE